MTVMKMDIVLQEKFGDCGPACVATVLGMPIGRVRPMFNRPEKRGVTGGEVVAALMANGVVAIESLTWPSYSIPAILSVPSLNHPGLLHLIVWDGERYLDPTNEELVYPYDAPIVAGSQVVPQWATAILILDDLRDLS